MPDFILIDGDKANFLPNFGAAIVVVQPGTLKGSGPSTLQGKKSVWTAMKSSCQSPAAPT